MTLEARTFSQRRDHSAWGPVLARVADGDAPVLVVLPRSYDNSSGGNPLTYWTSEETEPLAICKPLIRADGSRSRFVPRRIGTWPSPIQLTRFESRRFVRRSTATLALSVHRALFIIFARNSAAKRTFWYLCIVPRSQQLVALTP